MFVNGSLWVKGKMLCHCLENWPRRLLKKLIWKIVSLASQYVRCKLYALMLSIGNKKIFIMKEDWEGLTFCKVKISGTRFIFQSKENQNIQGLDLRQQNTVTIKTQEVNKMNLYYPSLLLGGVNQVETADSLHWWEQAS